MLTTTAELLKILEAPFGEVRSFMSWSADGAHGDLYKILG